MLTTKHKYLLSFSLFMMTVVSVVSYADEKSNVAQVMHNIDCSNSLSDAQLSAIGRKYNDYKTNKMLVQAVPIELNGDELCDFLVEFQEDYPVCGEKPCDLMKQGRWTNFYLATSKGEYAKKAISAERNRWTGAGRYASYKLNGDTKPFIVWDLRSDGRSDEYANNYTVFKLSKGIGLLDAQTPYDFSVTQESAQRVLDFHQQQVQLSNERIDKKPGKYGAGL